MKRNYYLLGLLVLITSFNLTANAATTNTTPRIVGGHISKAGQWPWLVALVTKGSNNYDGQFCGGSLVSPTWVVTAAHCVDGESINTFKIVANVLNLKTDKGESIAVKSIISHPKYNNYSDENDIALVQLTKPVTNAKVLPLIEGNPLLVKVTATIIGWGALSEADSDNGIYPELLSEAVLPIVSNTACNKVYNSITANMLCAGVNAGGVDTCQGDSGGPLIIQQKGQWRLAGITSNGYGCARAHYYGIYTRVSRYLNFINSKIK